MAEGRMIKKVLSKSKKFAALRTHNARLLYVMIYPHLDVEGRIDADPKLLKGRVLPYLNFSYLKIREYLEDMFRVGLIKLYEVNGDWYLECVKFKDLQKLNPEREAKSEIPPPTPELLQRTQELLQIDSGELPLKSKLSLSKDKLTLEGKKSPQKLLKYFGDKYKDFTKGMTYHANFKKEITLLKKALGTTPEAMLYDLMDIFFEKARAGDWVSDKVSLGVFYSQINKLQVQLAKERDGIQNKGKG